VAAVRDLPSRQRDAVAYRHVLGLSVAETATLMGTSEDAVRANAYQGIKRLKERAAWTKD
jgi:DNA-directed RNA polymerase specialized sigma24 family protein